MKNEKINLVLIIAVAILILVRGKNFTLQNVPLDVSILKENCKDLSNITDKYKCWEDLLDLTLKEKGIEAAFSVIDNLYKNEPLFVDACHAYTHKLGEAVYKLLVKGKDFDFPPQTASCGYGFYHGLTELLLQTKGPKEAGNLCDSKKSQITQVLYEACYHGIGHGALSQSAQDSSIWGNAQKMISFAINLCEEATNDSIQQSRCASGIFMEIRNYYDEGKLQLISIRDAPLSICKKQEDSYKMACYTQMNAVLKLIGSGNFSESAKFIEAIDEDEYATSAMITLAASVVDITKTNQKDNVLVCRNLQKRLHLPCIKGLALGFMLTGKPTVEYERAIDFCNSPILSEEERQSCFLSLLIDSKGMYPPDKIHLICEKIDSRYKDSYCPD